MAVSSSSSAQRARQELAERLREIRRDAGLTARALSAAAGWHESKTSRIESAKQAPSNADIQVWCRVCAADDREVDLVAASQAADAMYVEWRRVQRTGLRRLQSSQVPLYERTHLFRVYCPELVPGYFQTPEYARALLSAVTDFYHAPEDVDEIVAARMARNRVVGSNSRFFMIIMEELVLRCQIGDTDVMTAQLHRLLSIMTLPSVSLGVIPFTTPSRHMWIQEGFTVFDDTRVHIDLLSALVTITAPSETSLYVRAFEAYAKLAVYGEQARALIMAAIDSLKQPPGKLQKR